MSATKSEAYTLSFWTSDGLAITAKLHRGTDGYFGKLTLQFSNPTAQETPVGDEYYSELLRWLLGIEARFAAMKKPLEDLEEMREKDAAYILASPGSEPI